MHLDRANADGSNSISSLTDKNDSSTFVIPVIQNLNATHTVKELKKSHTFFLDADAFEQIGENDTTFSLMESNLPVCFSVILAYDSAPIDKSVGIIYAAIILFGLYVMII